MTHIAEIIPAAVKKIKSNKGRIMNPEHTPIKAAIDVLCRMKVPSRYIDATFKSYDDTFNNHSEQVKVIQNLAKQRRWIHICSGSDKETPGIGKTHLAVAAMLESWLHDTHIKPEWMWKHEEIAPQMQYDSERYCFIDVRVQGEIIRMAGINRPKMLEYWMAKRFLLLDDLGYENNDIISFFNALINHFYGANRQIIITTSLPPPLFRKRYGGAISDRFNECGEFVKLTGKSYRQRDRSQSSGEG